MKYLGFLVCLLLPQISSAAACCGGGFAFPSLILNDDKHQLTLSLGKQSILADAQSGNDWIRRNDDNSTTRLKIDAATLISDQFQLGLSLQGSHKSNDTNTASYNYGDTQLFFAHETFPELYFSRWKPHGITFLQLTLPTGKSIYEESTFTKLDGQGFYTLGAGLALTKSFKVWDFNFNMDLHKSLSRNFDQHGQRITVDPGYGSIQTVGMGYNMGDLRLGTFLTHSFEDRLKVSTTTTNTTLSQSSYTLGVVINYLLNVKHAFTLNYSNQSLLGKPQNTALTEGIILSYQHRWAR